MESRGKMIRIGKNVYEVNYETKEVFKLRGGKIRSQEKAEYILKFALSNYGK